MISKKKKMCVQRLKGYFVDTIGRNKEQIAEYVHHQQQEDYVAE